MNADIITNTTYPHSSVEGFQGRESAQGEPSDARAKVIDALVMTRLSDFAGTDMGVIEQAADAVLAALRAAGGVR